MKVCPIGEVVGLDGRTYKIDPKVLLSSIQKNALDIPLDENHGYGKAIGWFPFQSFEAKEDGIYASLELNIEGKALLEGRSYRYLSPVLDTLSDRRVVGLDSVGLVNRPNLLNQALNSKETQPNHKEKNVNDEKERSPKDMDFMEQNARMLQQNAKLLEANAKIAALEQNIKEMNQKLREQKIEGAIKAGELLANKREFALSLENNEQLQKFLDVSKSDTEALKKFTQYEPNSKTQGNDIENTEEYKSVAAQLGL